MMYFEGPRDGIHEGKLPEDPFELARVLGLEFLDHLELSGYSPETCRSYHFGLSQYLTYLKERKTDFRKVGYSDLLRYIEAIRKGILKQSTLRQRLASVASWYRWLLRREIVQRNPCDLLGGFKVPRPSPKFYSEEQTAALLEAARTSPVMPERNLALIEFIYASGCRRSEASNLNAADLFLNDGASYARIRNGKGGKDRMAILGDAFVEAWRAYEPIRAAILFKYGRPTEPAAFVTVSGSRVHRDTIYYQFAELCKRAKVPVLGPHAMRHSTATHMLNNGADLMDIKEQLGHASLSTTQVYLHIAFERRLERYQRTHPNAKPRRGTAN